MCKKRDKCFQGFHLSPKHHHNKGSRPKKLTFLGDIKRNETPGGGGAPQMRPYCGLGT